jgi:hypothetical protein
MNNTMILDHHGLFIYIDSSYLGSYHDVNIFHHLAIYWKWHQYFTHHDDYLEYLLRVPKYFGEEMFIMRRMGRRKLPPNVDYDGIHARFKTKCMWGLGSKWNGELVDLNENGNVSWKYLIP